MKATLSEIVKLSKVLGDEFFINICGTDVSLRYDNDNTVKVFCKGYFTYHSDVNDIKRVFNLNDNEYEFIVEK